MQDISKYFLFCLIALFIFTSCSKLPVREINSARSAVDAAVSEGAEKYSPAEAKKVNDELASAMNEVKAQDSKFFKDYTRAKEMLAKVRADADAVKEGLEVKKEEAKKDALSAADSAKSAVDEVKTLLAKASKDKKSKMDSDALDAEIKSLDEAFLDVKKSIDIEDYITASEKAGIIKDKAAVLSGQVKQALEKPAAKKVTLVKKTRRKKIG